MVVPPCASVCERGVADTAKSATLRVAVAFCESVCAVPVTVTVVFPGAAPAVVIVNVEVPAPVIEGGLKVPLTPAGSGPTPKMTVELKPASGVTVTVNVVVPVDVTLAVLGASDNWKS